MSEEQMEGRDLPRPATPGPWYPAESLEVPLVMTKAHSTLVCTVHPYAASPDMWGADDDARAIAALPEWIVDRDRWKARAEQAEAERGAATDRATEHEMVLSAIADVCASADHTSDVQRVNVIMDLLTAHGYAREAADV